MLIIRLTDGIGNQLFQVANGLIYASESNKILKVDQDSFFGCKSSKNKLSNFNLEIGVASRNDLIKSSFVFILSNSFLKVLTKLLKISRIKRIFAHQKSLHSSHIINKLNSSYYFDYFQICNNFNQYRNLLIEKFKFNITISEKAKELKAKIFESNSIAIHIRRGDYLDKENSNFYNLLTEQYYIKALNFALSEIDSPKLFLFSDDLIWVKKI